MAKNISVFEDGTISCDGQYCDLAWLYYGCDECGDCPLVKIHKNLLGVELM